MQLCCVSDWPLRALSWQQSEGGTPGLPAPLNQEASAAPLYCTSGEFRLCSAFSFSIPLKLHRDLSCPPPPWKMGSTVFLVSVAFVFFGSEEKPGSTIPLHIYLFSPFFSPSTDSRRENVGCLFLSPFFIFFPPPLIFIPSKQTLVPPFSPKPLSPPPHNSSGWSSSRGGGGSERVSFVKPQNSTPHLISGTRTQAQLELPRRAPQK